MPDPPGALAPVFGVRGSLELEGAEAISVDRQLLLKLVQEVGREPVDLGGLGMAWKGILIGHFKVRVVMDPWKCAAVGNLVVEWKEAIAVERVGRGESRVHCVGVCGAEEIGIPVLGGIKRVLGGVQVIREMAASVIS